MEPTGLVYMTVVLGGILLTTPDPIDYEKCAAMKSQNATTLCIDVEPDCGKASGAPPCLGTALAEEKAATPKKRRTTARKRVRRSGTPQFIAARTLQ